MKKLLFIILTLFSLQSFAQDTIYVRPRGIPGVYNLSLNGGGDSIIFYVAGVRHALYIGATAGTGSVTSVAKGYGILQDGTITTTGTITVDSAALADKFKRITDSTDVSTLNGGKIDTSRLPISKLYIQQAGAGETHIIRAADDTTLSVATLKNTDDITISKASDSAVLLNFTHPHYTKDQVDSIKATITADGITRAELIDTADNKVNKTDISGGTINQVLKKNSSTDYDWSWQDESGGGGGNDSVYVDLNVSPDSTRLYARRLNGNIDTLNWTGNYITQQQLDDTAYNIRQSMPVPFALPSQVGNAGKWLYTNGDTASWAANNGWSTNGNALTDTSVNFIGTTDNQPFAFRVNNKKVALFGTNNTLDFGDISDATSAEHFLISPTSLSFIKNGSTGLTATLKLEPSYGGLSVRNSNDALYLPFTASKIKTVRIESGGVASQYESLTFLSNAYPGADVESMIFQDNFSTVKNRIVIYGGNTNNNLHPVSLIPGGDGSVIIGGDKSKKENTTILNVVSTSKAAIPNPKMTTVQRDSITGAILSGTIITPGSGYVTGTYTLVPLNGGTGTGATATITVDGSGKVSSVTAYNTGFGYHLDTLTINSSDVGGTGSGFSFKVTSVSGTSGSYIYNTDKNTSNFFNGVNWCGDLIITSAAALTLKQGQDYVFTGTTSTWTLPSIVAGITGRQNSIKIKNRGSGSITLNAVGSTLYTTAAVSSITISAGASCELMPDGTYNLVMYNN